MHLRISAIVETLGRAGVRSAAVGFAAVALVGFDQGGYFPRSWVWAGLGFAAAAALALLLRGRFVLGPLERSSLGLLAALCVWMAASGLWGIPGTEAGREAGRALVYVTALAAFLFVVDRASIDALLAGALGGVVLLSSYGLGDRLIRTPSPDVFQGRLLVGPLGYANALGILAAMGLLLAMGFLVIEQRQPHRALAAASAAILLVTLLLTSSRGAWLAVVCGLGVLVGLYPRGERWGSRRRGWFVGAVVAVVVLAGAAAAVRTSTTLGDRPAYWRAALHDARDHPLLGSGAGSYDDYWYAHRDVPANVRDAHSLYLESLAELGPVGLVLLLGALLPPLAAAVLMRRRPAVAVAAAAYAAFLVHVGLDWDWEMPATIVAGLSCAAALLAATRPPIVDKPC